MLLIKMDGDDKCGGCFFKWKYKHYFEFCDRKNKNITVKCKLCANSKELSTAVNSTSNLLKHLNRVHSTKLVAKEDNVTHARDGSGATSSKQARLDFFSRSGGKVTSGQVKRAVNFHFVVEKQLHFSIQICNVYICI